MESHKDEVEAALKKQIANALEAIGGEAEKHAKEACPVDTGRLRNSITFATLKKQGTPNASGGADAKASDYAMKGTPSEDAVVVGTNVEYAPEQEYYGRKAHFLRNSMTNYGEEYKKILQTALET